MGDNARKEKSKNKKHKTGIDESKKRIDCKKKENDKNKTPKIRPVKKGKGLKHDLESGTM